MELEALISKLERLECEPAGLSKALPTSRLNVGRLRERNTTLIRKAIEMIGPDAAKRLLERTFETQRTGGLRTLDGKRKRSPGGVFFFLLRDELDADAYRRLMADDAKRRRKRRREA